MSWAWAGAWCEPQEGDHVALLSFARLDDVGGVDQWEQAMAILARWTRTNCVDRGRPVNVRGRPGWLFNNVQDAVKFKITWG